MQPLIYERPHPSRYSANKQQKVMLNDEAFEIVGSAAFVSGKSYSKVASEMIEHLYKTGLLQIEGDNYEHQDQ
ncbi:MAG: hypothetical protein RR219_09760 [Clostridiales bacterium]